MAMIKCPECGQEISDKSKKCIHCGYPIKKTLEKGKPVKIKKIIIVVAIIFAIAAIIGTMMCVFLNSNPVEKYIYYFEHDNSKEAISVYNDKIQGDKELDKELSSKQNSELDNILAQYKRNKITFEEAKTKIQKFEQYVPSKKYALKIMEKINSLNNSRIAFKNAQDAENDGNIETALKEYSNVIEDDESYTDAQKKINSLQDEFKGQLLDEAEKYAKNKEYDEAISSVTKLISILGESDELTELKDKYTKMKSEQYVKIVVVDKSVTPKDINKWIFNNYVNFVFDITNNSDKSIKGIEGTLIVSDLFDKEIIQIGCDFTGRTIKAGETYRNDKLSFECNEFMDDDMKFYNTDYSDLKFQYEISKIVYSDGTTIEPK